MQLAYLACPYSHQYRRVRIQRYEAITRFAGKLMREGYAVFSPITHSHPIEATFPEASGWEFWKDQDLPILARCDLLIVATFPGWENSVGVGAEIAYAEELAKEVIYRDDWGTFYTYG